MIYVEMVQKLIIRGEYMLCQSYLTGIKANRRKIKYTATYKLTCFTVLKRKYCILIL